MKKTLQKTLLAALLLLCSTVATAHDFEVDGIYYNITDATAKTVAVTYKGEYSIYYPDEYSGSVNIPATVTYSATTYSVTSIGSFAFYECYSLTSITIPEGVTSIGEGAFRDCTSLASITIPNSVTSIGYEAFEGCFRLESITIPNSVTSIGDYAFEGCTALTSITIPNSVTSIGDGAFSSCSDLASITINNSAIEIGYNAFNATLWYTSQHDGVVYIDKILYKYKGTMPANTNIIVKENTTNIAGYAFRDCNNLKSITLPSSVTSIGRYAFDGCEQLKLVYNYSALELYPGYSTNVDGGVAENAVVIITPENADNYTFHGDSIGGNYLFSTIEGEHTLALYIGDETYPTLPEDFNGEGYAIGEKAFYNCTNLKSFTIPSSVTSIDGIPFEGTAWYSSLSDGLIYKDKWLLGYKGSKPSGTLSIARGTVGIAGSAFSSCKNLMDVTIPNSVKIIGDKAFNSCENLGYVTIGEGVEIIGDRAFYYCPNITDITIPASVTTIGDEAFYYCSSITDITIPTSVTSIGYQAFGDCGFESITIEGSITSMGNYAFYYCDNLTNVTIGDNVKIIGDNAFFGCENLTKVTIGKSVTSIGNDAFSGTDIAKVYISDLAAWCNIDFKDRYSNPLQYSLYVGEELITDLVIPEGVTTIKDYAFFNCDNIKSVTIPNSVTSIGNQAFFYCSSLASVTIGEGVTSIGNQAFAHCYDLKTVYNYSPNLNIVAGSTDNGYVACYADSVINYGCFVFETINGVNTLTGYTGSDAVLVLPNNYNGAGYVIGTEAFKENTTITSVTIPEGVTSIGESAFWGCTSLSSITIPNSVTSIEDCAFCYCTRLASITIPSTVTTIDDYAFYECTGLESVTLNEGLETLGLGAFGMCSALKNITIPSTVKTIKVGAFVSCTTLSSATLNEGLETLDMEAFWGCSLKTVTIPSTVKTIGVRAFAWCESLTSVTLKEGLEKIDADAFAECNNLQSITFPSTLDSIGTEAFYNCDVLASATLNEGLEYIGEWAFNRCYKLSSITFPEGLKYIGDAAFTYCYTLSNNIIIPESVEFIGKWVFSACYNINGMKVDKNNKVYDSRNDCNSIIETATNTLISGCNSSIIPDGIEIIGEEAFWGRLYLPSITIPNSVVEIKDYAFVDCDQVTHITIPESLTTIGKYAFEHCSVLLELVIGKNVTQIGNNAFAECISLERIYANSATPPAIDETVFQSSSDVIYSNATLYVPAGAKAAYEAADGWKKFANIVETEFEEEGITGDVNGDGSVDVADVTTIVAMILDKDLYDLSGDVDGDGSVDVADITSVVSVILGTNKASARAAEQGVYNVELTAEGDDNALEIEAATCDYPYCAVQFDVYLPEGVTATDYVSAAGNAACGELADGAVRVVVFSADNSCIAGESIRLNINTATLGEGSYPVEIKNVTLSAAGRNKVLARDAAGYITIGGTTGIDGVVSEAGDEVVYDLQGRRVTELVRGGIYIKNGKKFIAR